MQAMRDDEDTADLQRAVAELHRVTGVLNRRAKVISVASVANLIGFVLAAALEVVVPVPGSAELQIPLGTLLSALTVILVVVGLIEFDRERRQGNSIFEEVSDELQWSVLARARDAPRQRPDLNIRIALRRFNDASRLSMVPGDRGVPVYAIVNLLLLLGTVALTWSANLS